MHSLIFQYALWVTVGFYLLSLSSHILHRQATGLIALSIGFIFHTLFLLSRAGLLGFWYPIPFFEETFFLPWTMALIGMGLNIFSKKRNGFNSLLFPLGFVSVLTLFFPRGIIPPSPKHLTVYACLFLASEILAIGSYYFKAFPTLLNPLNFSLLQDWYFLYGRPYPERIWWFGTLLVLLSILGLNTFFCALRRLLQLWPIRKQLGTRFFFIKIAPTFIHFSFLIILSGHFISLIIGYHQVVPLATELKGQVPGGITWELIEQGCERYSFPDSLKGSIRQCSVTLRLQDSKGNLTKKVAILHPLRWNGYSFHLDLTGKQRGGSTLADPKVNLIIKNDPGLKFILSGFLVMCALMGWYFPQRKYFKEVF